MSAVQLSPGIGWKYAAVSAQGERGACYQALGYGVAALAEQVMSLAEDDVQLAGVVVPDFAAGSSVPAR